MGLFGRRERTRGFPTSSNGASSMHLWWEPTPSALSRASVVLEVVEPPRVDRLYFWAMQVSFVDGTRTVGGAHLGLQWHPAHPGGTAVNWGGYRDGGGELDGEVSALPSALGNANTRDFEWRPRRSYRLTVSDAGDGWWGGEVTDLDTGLTTLVRRLFGGGSALARVGVWSEVFARCHDPSTVVRWSGFVPATSALRTTYQSREAGGCANSASVADRDGVLQITNVERTGADGDVIVLAP